MKAAPFFIISYVIVCGKVIGGGKRCVFHAADGKVILFNRCLTGAMGVEDIMVAGRLHSLRFTCEFEGWILERYPLAKPPTIGIVPLTAKTAILR